MFTYTFDPELEILMMKSTGKKRVSDIKKHYDKLPKYKKRNRNLYVLIDARETSMDVKHEEIKELFIPLVKAVKSFDTLKEAILINNPAETAIATLFKIEFTKLPSYSFKIFSTENAAIEWLSEKKVQLTE